MQHFEIGTFDDIGYDVISKTLTGDAFLERHRIEPMIINPMSSLEDLKQKMKDAGLGYEVKKK